MCEQLLADDHVGDVVDAIVDVIVASIREGGKVLLCGNGGSAAEAEHLAAELIGRFCFDRSPFPAVALASNVAALTAIANDYDYDDVYARAVTGLGRSGDVVMGLSTSGRSANVVAALKAGRDGGMVTVALDRPAGLTDGRGRRSHALRAGDAHCGDPGGAPPPRARHLRARRAGAVSGVTGRRCRVPRSRRDHQRQGRRRGVRDDPRRAAAPARCGGRGPPPQRRRRAGGGRVQPARDLPRPHDRGRSRGGPCAALRPAGRGGRGTRSMRSCTAPTTSANAIAASPASACSSSAVRAFPDIDPARSVLIGDSRVRRRGGPALRRP